MLKKIIWANFQRIKELFTPKNVNKLSKIWVWDPGSKKKPTPDHGSRGQKGTGSRIRIRNTGKSVSKDPKQQCCGSGSRGSGPINSELRIIRKSGFVRNIYGSTTLLNNVKPVFRIRIQEDKNDPKKENLTYSCFKMLEKKN
jgi:hypothetical protein